MLFISAFISVYLLGEQSHYKDVSHVKFQCLNFFYWEDQSRLLQFDLLTRGGLPDNERDT